MPAESAADVLERRRQVVIAHDLNGFADLFAADGALEIPFAGPGMPARVEGREAIRAFSLSGATAPFRITDLQTVHLYQTTDPETVIAEIVTTGRATATGRTFAQPCIQVVQIRDGEILLLRDYFDPHAIADVLAPA